MANQITIHDTLVTNGLGTCKFGFLKTSSSNVSRIDAEIFDSNWKTFGEVLTIGTLDVEPAGLEGKISSEQGFKIPR